MAVAFLPLQEMLIRHYPRGIDLRWKLSKDESMGCLVNWSVTFTWYGQIRNKRRVAEKATIVSKLVSRHQNLRETRFTGVAFWVSHEMIPTVPEKSDRFGCGPWNGQGVVSKYFQCVPITSAFGFAVSWSLMEHFFPRLRIRSTW